MTAWADMTPAEKGAAPPLRMFSKGADNVMATRLRDGCMPKAKRDATFQHVEDFSQDGLRILVICQKEFTDYKVRSTARVCLRFVASLGRPGSASALGFSALSV